MNQIIEPKSQLSKLILGGKGSGKTHILRYYSYKATRLRNPQQNGIEILNREKFLAIFLRANGLDASRFELISDTPAKWRQAFATYLELRIVESVLDAILDVRQSAKNESFDDKAFMQEICRVVSDPEVLALQTVDKFQSWVQRIRVDIDERVNNAAFIGTLELRIPFSVGALCLNLRKCIEVWHPRLRGLSLIYLLDEIENFSKQQQQVVNSFIRYAEGRVTFRVGGRLYAMKTHATMADGEENREGSEFKTVHLDDILRAFKGYPEFARKFVYKRLTSVGLSENDLGSSMGDFDPSRHFAEVESGNAYQSFLKSFITEGQETHLQAFETVLSLWRQNDDRGNLNVSAVLTALVEGFPLLIQKLNILCFCKKASRPSDARDVANEIRESAVRFLDGVAGKKDSYTIAYGHYAQDLVAQLCRDYKRSRGVPYAGFDTFVRMSCGNPRNLLIILERAYAIAAFRNEDFIKGSPLSVNRQTEAALEAARFVFEQDVILGTETEVVRESIARLAQLLRTARYSLNVPEVSPAVVSFADSYLTEPARTILRAALNSSFLFELSEGRPARNSQALNRKIQINPILAPRWGLPIARRGDVSLSRELVNAIFKPDGRREFDMLLGALEYRWNNPFSKSRALVGQTELF
nr:hypothetical protein [Nitrosospira multiformis]